MNKEDIKENSKTETKDTKVKSEKPSTKKDGSNNKIIIEIVSCLVAIVAIVLAMIFILKGKENKDNITLIEAKNATVFEAGNIKCWYNVAKDKYYSDKKGKNELSADDVFTYVIDKSTSGLVKYDGDGKYYYFKDGIVDKSYTGFAKDGNDWIYFVKGVNDNTLSDVVKGTVYGEEAWWCVKEGKVAFIDTVAKNKDGWFNIEKGKVVFRTTIASNENGTFYCKGGRVDFSYSGEYSYEKKIYEIKGGKVVSVKDDPKYAGKVEYYVDKSDAKDVVNSDNEATLIEGFKYFEEKTGVRAYLYIIESLPSDSLDDYLEQLCSDIFGDKDGIIIVYVDFEDMFWVYTRENSSIGLRDKTKITEAIRNKQDESDKAVRFGDALKAAADELHPSDDKTDDGNDDGSADGDNASEE